MNTKFRITSNLVVMLGLLVTACTQAKVTSEVQHTQQPGQPVYTETIYDCNTGQTASKSNLIQPNEGCDSWQINRYERPFNAESQDTFFPDLDILSAEIGQAGEWLYFRLTIFDVNEESGYLNGTYALEIDLDLDGRGDVLLVAAAPGEEAAQNWTTQRVFFWGDSNNDVGNQLPQSPDFEGDFDGYDTLVFNQGEGEDADLAWVRLQAGTSATLEFALKYEAILFDPVFKWWAWSDQGVADPARADYHDTFNHPDAGDPIQGQTYFPVKAIAEIDNTCASIWGAPPSEDPELCANDPAVEPPSLQPTFMATAEESTTPTFTSTLPSDTETPSPSPTNPNTSETPSPTPDDGTGTPSPTPTECVQMVWTGQYDEAGAPVFEPLPCTPTPTASPTPTECVPQEIPEELQEALQTLQAGGGGPLTRGEVTGTPGPASDAWATVMAAITQTPGSGLTRGENFPCTPTPTPTETATPTERPCLPANATAGVPAGTCTPTPSPTPSVTPTDCLVPYAFAAINCTPTPRATPTATATLCIEFDDAGAPTGCTPTPTMTATATVCVEFGATALIVCTPTPTATECVSPVTGAAAVPCTPTPTPTQCVGFIWQGYDEAGNQIYETVECTPTPETAAMMVYPDQDTNCRQATTADARILDTLYEGVGYLPLGRSPDNLFLLFRGPVTNQRCWAPTFLFDIPFGPLNQVPASVLPYVNVPTATPTATAGSGGGSGGDTSTSTPTLVPTATPTRVPIIN